MLSDRSESYPLRRRDVAARLLHDRGDLLVVAGLGAPAWDVTAAGDDPLTFPLWGAMGGAAMIGLGLALACDLRVVEQSAVFGVFSRRWGVPMSDGTTVRLPRLIGLGRALDMLLTGRAVVPNTVHVAVGALVLANSLAMTLCAWRGVRVLERAAAPAGGNRAESLELREAAS